MKILSKQLAFLISLVPIVKRLPSMILWRPHFNIHGQIMGEQRSLCRFMASTGFDVKGNRIYLRRTVYLYPLIEQTEATPVHNASLLYGPTYHTRHFKAKMSLFHERGPSDTH